MKNLDSLQNKNIYISIWLSNLGWVPAGSIVFNEGYGFSGFVYFESYMKENYPPLNPATLNYRDTNHGSFVTDINVNPDFLDRTFSELLPTKGDFAHQAMINKYPQYQGLNNVQRLYFLGQRTVGGLSSYKQKQKDEISIDSLDWLNETRRESVDFHMNDIARLYQNGDAFLAMTSYGGVRPKAMYKDEDGRFWIAKFNLPSDPYNMAIAEHIAMRMASDAGMKVPDTKVLTMSDGEHIFLTERFDRNLKGRRHSLSLYTLVPGLETGYKKPKQTAATIATIIRRFSDFKDLDTTNIITKLLIDIGFNNTDNHLRNTRLILNEDNLWELSPAFDITFNPRSQPHIYNPSGLTLEETFLENDEIIEALASQTGADVHVVFEQREKVKKVTQNWKMYCDQFGLSEEDQIKIESAISLGHNRTEMQYKAKIEQRRKVEEALKMHKKLTR